VPSPLSVPLPSPRPPRVPVCLCAPVRVPVRVPLSVPLSPCLRAPDPEPEPELVSLSQSSLVTKRARGAVRGQVPQREKAPVGARKNKGVDLHRSRAQNPPRAIPRDHVSCPP